MHLGLFCDLRNPAQWRRPWADHYRQTLAWIRDAEHLGADAVWLTEHHFFDDGYLPQPLTLAAAIAAQTERVRIGTAIVLGALRHPLHLAEEAAIVDLF
jgi:alkanesulfonate monooxygenase SsuD/methylene tetrahydromethanopterin reductase-like flavin-dependent oxidoreductase (luciferase family)